MTEEFDPKAARAKRPMPVWVDAFVRDTMDLDAEQIGAYNLLLWAMWSRHEVELPFDLRKLAVICRVTPTKFKRHIWPDLEGFFEVTDGKVSQKRLKKEATFVEGFCEKQGNKKRGKKSGNPSKTNKQTQSADDPQIIRGSPADQSADDPTQQPNNPTDNNSEDKSSSLSSPPDPGNDDGYSDFLKAHPRSRETARGEQAWSDLVAGGTDPQTLIAAAQRYAEASKTYDADKVKFADNWLIDGAWRQHLPSKADAPPDQTEKRAFWAKQITAGGKVFGLSEAMAADCVAAGLVSKEQANAALAAMGAG